MVSQYRALEVLGDEEQVTPLEGLAAPSPKPAKKGGAKVPAGAKAPAAPDHGTLAGSGMGDCISNGLASASISNKPGADGFRMGACSPCHGASAAENEPEYTEEQVQQMHTKFMRFVNRKGKWDHFWLVNCLNPVTAHHDPEIRAAYKQLPKPVQQLVWRSIPAGGPPKQQPAGPAVARGIRGSAVPVARPAAPSQAVLKPHLASPPPPAPPAGDWTPGVEKYIQFLITRGIRHHSSLTTALNVSAPAYDAHVRVAYKALCRTDQSAVWRVLPKDSPEKPCGVNGVSSTPSVTAPSSGAPNHAITHPKAGFGGPILGSSVGTRPVMSRLGCRPGARTVPTRAPLQPPVSHAAAPRELPATGVPPGVSAPAWSYAGASSHRANGSCVSSLSWAVQQPGSAAAYSDLDEEESKLCVVCLDKSRDALVLPCKHTVMCVSCAVLVKNSTGECPYCRAGIDTVMSVQDR